MQKHFAIFNSDQLSKDGKRFTISALEDGIWQVAIFGVPSNLSHDIHRPVGWAYAKGLYFNVESVLTIGHFLIATDSADNVEINTARNSFFTHMMNTNIAPHADNFIEELGDLYKDSEDKKWFYNGLVMYGYREILLEAFPEIKAKMESDKASLVDLEYLLKEFTYLSQGVFKKNNSNLSVIAHPYFRKSLSLYNNFHWIFLDELVSMHGNTDITLKIKLDTDYLGYAPSFITAHEFEYWWGPKYNNDITSIEPGLTQYKSDEFERLYYNIDRTEFVWKNDGKLFTMELEEVRDQPAPTLNDIYGCRYMHSIFDRAKDAFDHFDGAIRAYSTDLMIERIDKKMTEMGRQSEYTKLFRIDGKLAISDWKSLATNYMQGNPQIYEYFGLEKPSVQQVDSTGVLSAMEKYVPYSINENDGIRLYVSYHEREEVQDHARSFSSHDVITLKEGRIKVIDHFATEVKKAIEEVGGTIVLPADILFVLPEDYYCNIPNVFHWDKDAQMLVDQTVDGLRLLLNKMVLRKGSEIMSISLSWNVEDKEVVLSFMGHVSDLNHWLQSFQSIPVARTEFKSWLESQAVYIKSNGINTACPVMSEIVCGDGMLFFKRRLVQKDAKLTFPDQNDFNKSELEFDDDKEDLIGAINQNQITFAPMILVRKMICTTSGLDYHLSPHSVIDNSTSQEMKDFSIASFHWTDKARPISVGS